MDQEIQAEENEGSESSRSRCRRQKKGSTKRLEKLSQAGPSVVVVSRRAGITRRGYKLGKSLGLEHNELGTTALRSRVNEFTLQNAQVLGFGAAEELFNYSHGAFFAPYCGQLSSRKFSIRVKGTRCSCHCRICVQFSELMVAARGFALDCPATESFQVSSEDNLERANECKAA